MKATDKMLIGIVVAIVLIVVVALIVTLTKPEDTYLSDDTPEGVVHNYLLALSREDYRKAWNYLSPNMPGYPRSIQYFMDDMQRYSYLFSLDRESTFSIFEAESKGINATVIVNETWLRGGDLFDSRQASRNFEVNLRLITGTWMIIDADSYFARCWLSSNGCR